MKSISSFFYFIVLLTFFVQCKNNNEKGKTLDKHLKENAISNNVVQQLLQGNKRLLNNTQIHKHQDLESIKKTENEQHPFAVVISCSDSRVSPSIIFDQGIGDLFVIRNAGNLISEIDLGSIEYAVEHLHVKDIIVMGHTECGAIKAFVSDTTCVYKKHCSHIDALVETIAKEQEIRKIDRHLFTNKDFLNSCIKANILHSILQIKNSKIVENHHVTITPMIYDVHSGKATILSNL